MMRKTLLIVCLLLVMSSWGRAEEARLLRFPTTNGKDVVFSYAGDLYRAPLEGGEAVRLTSHVGTEIFPHFSPDGKLIAFSGQYDGNSEVYVIPVEGGEPKRLTFTATNSRDDLGDRMGPNNIVMGWNPDGKHIVFRNRIGDGFAGNLYEVSIEGAMPTEIPLPQGGFCSFSPDGKKLAYNRVFREFRTWKYYKGGMADDVWVYDFKTKQTKNITNNVAQDIFPMWIGNKIYFISDRDRTMNLFVYNQDDKSTKKVTSFAEYDVKFPSVNGTDIVFENAGYIYHYDAVQNKLNKLSITLQSDNIYARPEVKNGEDYIRSLSLSPDAKRVIVTARGEIFNVPVKEGVTKNISRTPGAHERSASWSPDGKSVVYISDQSGESELWQYFVEDARLEQLTKENDAYISSFEWSNDGKTIVYGDRKNRLFLIDVASKTKKLLFQDDYRAPYDVVFSPDSKWLAYSRPVENEFSVIFLYDLKTGKEYPVTDKWFQSYAPLFSADGKYLLFTSDRTFRPTYGSLEWNHVYNNMGGLYMTMLSKDTPSPFLNYDGETPKEESEKKEEKNNDIKIDIDGLNERIVALPVSNGYAQFIYAKDNDLYYRRGGGLYLYNLQDQKEESILGGGFMEVTPDGKHALIGKQGKYYVSSLPKGKFSGKKAIDMSNMKIPVDYAQEWPQIFNEAWRIYRDGFYLENMHGVDWKKMHDKYAVLLPYVKSRLDLNYLIGELIGELNVGHAYVNPGEMPRVKRVPMGLLGAKIEKQKNGYFKIVHILEGATWSQTLRSPLNHPGLNIKEGDFILAIDGISTKDVANIYELLIGKAGVATELTVNSSASIKGAHKIVVKPIDNEDPLYHYEWVQNNIKKVEKASNGRIGYIYIPDMGPEGLNQFVRYFYPQLDKEGLIIDDRANGGGNVSPMILERLSREPYRLTMRRGSKRVGTVPDAVQVGPKVCLINKYSASDGDLFPWGFRALGLGKLIGTRTWGGIVGISGSLPYMDGTDIRVPFFTSFDIKTGDWIIENYGVKPDIEIENDPAKEWAGEDEQLNRAIEEVMKQLPKRKKIPGIPAPRDFSK